jgi:hypothetical protein
MALTYRQTKGSALTIQELDANFEYFTGSHSVTGSFTTSGSIVVTGSVDITGSINLSGLLTITNVSGALLTPTASLTGTAPIFSGSEGQFLFGSGSNGYGMFVWLGGAWRSGSLS